MLLFYNSFLKQHKSPFGAVTLEENITIRVKAIQTENVFINLYEEETKHQHLMTRQNDDFFEYQFKAPSSVGLLFYNFEAVNKNERKLYGPEEKCNGKAGEIHDEKKRYQLTVSVKNNTPAWFKEGNMYQIYVDRFFNGNDHQHIFRQKKNCLIHSDWNDKPVYIRDKDNKIISWDFFGGNLKGVTGKLPYLSELGITIIYLNPIFESSSNHKYDTGDYSRIDGMYGEEDDFRELIIKAGEYGMKIILDGVFSHTGSDSVYFNKEGNYPGIGAYQSKQSKYYDWFHFKNYPDSYDCWWDIESMPNLNELNEGFLDYLFNIDYGVIRKWMRMGIYGFRLDVADELPGEFIRLLKQVVREENSESILLGEVWEDASNKISYHNRRIYILGDRLDSVTNYPLRDNLISLLNGDISSDRFIFEITCLFENYPQEVFYSLMNMTGTHDTIRLLNLFAGCRNNDSLDTFEKRRYVIPETALESAVRKLLSYATAVFSLPGIPCLYYGDEAGMQGYEDPYNRGTFPWGDENPLIQNHIKNLAQLRKREVSLRKGSLEFIKNEMNVLIIKRTFENKTILTFINNSAEDVPLEKVNVLNDFNILFSIDSIDDDKGDLIRPYGSIIISSK
ncbi:MAG: glycoside hydrolase family 13 protein [Clostridia bacterium]|nr:glycoside hydrolase family 13 protein [Clostridia bacterium]